jgi:O-antigen/teichoic acid export membrane protein
MGAGVISGFANTVVSRVLGLIVIAVCYRQLGASLFGVFAVSTALTASQGLFDLGASAATARFTANANESNDRAAVINTMRRSFAIYLAISALYGLVASLFIGPLLGALDVPSQYVGNARVLLVASIPLFLISNMVIAAGAGLVGLQRVTSYNTVQAFGQIVLLATLLTLTGWGAISSVYSIVLSFGLMYVLQFVVLLWLVIRAIPQSRDLRNHATPSWREFLSFGAYAQITTTADFGFVQGSKIYVGVMLGSVAAGELDLAFRLGLLATSVAQPILPPILPAAAKLSIARRWDELAGLTVLITKLIATIIIPLAAAAIAGAAAFFAIIGVQASAQPTAAVVIAIVIGLGIKTLFGGVSTVLIGIGDSRATALSQAVGLAVSTSLTIIALRNLGISGIAVGILAGLVTSSVLQVWAIGRTEVRAATRGTWRVARSAIPVMGIGIAVGLVETQFHETSIVAKGLVGAVAAGASAILVLQLSREFRTAHIVAMLRGNPLST